MLLEAREITEADEETDEGEETESEAFEDDDDEDGPDLLRVRFTPAYAREFIAGRSGCSPRAARRARCAASRSTRRATCARGATGTS